MIRPNGVRRAKGSERGQVMVIFALVAVLIFAVMGLSIDAGTSFLASDRAERAAAAAALSGVPYLPSDFNNAQLVAKSEAARNGFRDGDTSRQIALTVSQPAPNKLSVSISQNVTTFFLQLVGFGNHTVVRSAMAEYLRPISLGQPGAQQGSDLGPGGLGSGTNNYYFMRTEGWGNPRSEGDAFTPKPNQGGTACPANTNGTSSCTASPPDVHNISASNGSEPADATGLLGVPLSDLGGYNYLVYVPPNQFGDVQVYNPAFAPDTPTGGYDYHEYDGSFSPGTTDKTQYGTMAYTVYSVGTVFTRQTDTKVSQELFRPFDATQLPNGYKWFDPAQGGAIQNVPSYTPDVYHSWQSALYYTPPTPEDQQLFDHPLSYPTNQGLPGGAKGTYYRLRVDQLDWAGNPPDRTSNSGSKAHKAYAVRVVTPGATTACPGCTLSALDDMCIFTPIKNTTSSPQSFDVPLFGIDSGYAGKVLTINVFDPGDVSGGNAYMSIMQPAYTGGGTNYAQQPAYAQRLSNLGPSVLSQTTQPIPSAGGPNQAYVQTANSAGVLYNGVWLQFQIKVPADFNSTAFWNLRYTINPNVTSADTITVQVGAAGAPVHLLP